MALAAATTLALTVPLAGVASADPDPKDVPSKAQVDRARAEVASKKQSVAQIEAALAGANARLEQAALDASVAAEAYNGAMWKLAEARKAYRLAQARERRARENVAVQRDGIVSLVTDSYQNGTELNSATAMMSDEGPRGLMNRYAVVESAGDSMEARYERFRVASALAKKYTKQAAGAEKKQESLAEEARALRDAASAAANSAAVAAGQIAVQKEALVEALAKAQNISVELAGKRHRALERIAQQRAAAAAKAREEARAAAARKQAEARKAAQKARDARKDQKKAQDDRSSSPATPGGGGYTSTGPPVSSNPPAPGTGAQRAIAYAQRQLGKPYVWAAAGPRAFDCSGLTMMAWRAGGKSLPHWSVAQFSMGTRIAVSAARPGDLVFWTSNGRPDGIHHVALYTGGGQFIEAARPGTLVRYGSISSNYPDLAVRP